MTEFVMPSLGADMTAGTLVKWRVGVGDTVSHGDIIAEVETDKGIIEVEVFESGVVQALLVKEGEKVPVGTPMAEIGEAEAESGAATETAAVAGAARATETAAESGAAAAPAAETETETETETTPTGGGEKPARAREEAPPPPSAVEELYEYVGEVPAVLDVAAMVGNQEWWAKGLIGLYGPQGTEERLMSGVPAEERPEVLATALIRYATDAEEWDSKFFRGFVRKAIAERKRDREPPSRDWGDETARDQARMEAYHQREVKRGEERRDEKAEAKSEEIAELLDWFDEQPEEVQKEIEADAEKRVRVMAVGMGPGKKPPDMMVRSAQFEAIRTAKEESDG